MMKHKPGFSNLRKLPPLVGLFACIFLLTFSTKAQEATDTLSLQEAVETAMEHNYNIKVAKTNQQISRNSVNIGNAGLLPRLSLSSGGNFQNQNTRQEFEQPLGEQTLRGAQSTSLNAALNLEYTLFDGLGNRYDYRRLKAEQNLTDAQARQTIEQTLLQVVNQYYQVARLKREARIAQQAVALSKQRLQRVQSQVEFGNKSRVDLLSARVDLDSDSTALINAQTQFSNARRSLNVLLGRNPSKPLAVQKDVSFKRNLRKADLLKAAQQQNSTLKAADYQVKTARLQHKIAKANYFPQVNLTSSYDYSESSQDAGFLKEQQTNGVSAGLQINMPLFQGFQNQIRAENTQMRLQNRKNQLQQAELNLKRDLTNAYATYQQNLRTLRMEKRNVENARLNLTRTREAYQIGQATSTQLREAQVNFTRAQSRLTNARYDAKLAEVELYQLAGLLLEEF